MTICRTLFRNGGSEYAINGDPCRLLDVQELLSDSGLGREMHVIVGQGQLDAVLRATPGGAPRLHRGGGGILKHRERKEKTLRKLEAMQTNLTRLRDLAGEIRRQLKPLGRQAEIAREAQTSRPSPRRPRRLLADDLVDARRRRWPRDEADEAAVLRPAGRPGTPRSPRPGRARTQLESSAAQRGLGHPGPGPGDLVRPVLADASGCAAPRAPGRPAAAPC